MQATTTENINNSFFDGVYKDIWRRLIPDGLTKAENDWILQEANLQAGDRLIDLMCGYGRHALALARKGIHVTAVDNLKEYVEEIRSTAQKENLPVECLEQDVLKLDVIRSSIVNYTSLSSNTTAANSAFATWRR